MQERRSVDTGRELNIELWIADVDGIEKIVIPEGKQDLKNLLRLLDEDLLESLLTETRYQVSSKCRIIG